MADISSLQLQPTEPLDFEVYKSAGSGGSFPKKGRYTLRAPDSFPSEAFKPNKAGTALTVQIDPTIVGPTGEGKVLRFTRISAKTFPRGGTTVSQLGDYLKACGITGTLSGNPQDQANAAEATAGQIFEADLDWDLYAKGEGPNGDVLHLEGMEAFPSDGNGGYRPWIESKTQVNPETGEPKKLWANLVIPMGGFVPRS